VSIGIIDIGGQPTLIRDLDFNARCCCGLPCIEWSRYARRLSTPIYANAPPPVFPCCGLLQSYSVQTTEFTINFATFRLSGAISVAADIEFEGYWFGVGGTFEVLDFFNGWQTYDLPVGFATLSHNQARCQYELVVGGTDGTSFEGSGIFRLDVSTGQGPTGTYPHQTIFGSASVS
jgi:hypothetical protein